MIYYNNSRKIKVMEVNEHTENKLYHFGCILRNLGLEKEQTGGILSMMEKEEMVDEIITQLENRDFKTTPQETMNICAAVIKRYKGL